MKMIREMLKTIPRGRLGESVDSTREKLEAAKAAWRKAKAKAGSSKSSPAYFKEVEAHKKVLDLQDQLDRELRVSESESRAFAAGYNEGDVVKVHTHKMGTDTGSYGKFNVLRVTPTQLHLTDNNDGGKVMKFNLKTKRGIGEHNNLLIKEGKGATFSATGDHEVEQNEIWIHVAQDGDYDSSGINVVFHKSGKIDATPGDSAAEEAWENHKSAIIKAAKELISKRKDIKDHMQHWK